VPICPNCKAPCGDENRFCPLCGADVTGAPPTNPPARAATGVIDSATRATRSLQRVETARDELVGQLIDGRYRIVGRIGEGGVGVVYRAEHIQLKRPVAVKVLHGLFAANPELRLRFEREALAASKAAHASCVAVLDFGTFAGRPYLVMEYVEGQLLSERLARGPLPAAEAVLLARQLLRALRHTHELGIVHRDIKPGNIMLCEPTRTGAQVKLLDFGLAKNLDGDAPGSATLTQAGSVFGTPGYLSPEQALGLPVDARGDVYSLGVVLFEMVCGRRPFVGNDQLDVIRAHINTPPPPARQLRPDLSPALEAVIARALEKDRARRFQTAEEFAAALGAVPEAALLEAALGATAGATGPHPLATASLPPTAGLAAPIAVAAAGPPPSVVGGTVPRPVAPAPRRPAGAATRLALLAGGGALLLVAAIGIALLGASWIRGLGHQPRRAAPSTTLARAPARSAPRGAARTGARPAAPPAVRSVVAASAPAAGSGATAAPGSPELRRAQAELAAGRLSGAIQAARRAAAKHHDDPRARLVLGHAYYRKGWCSDAIDEFRKAVRLDASLRSEPAMLREAVGCLGRRATAGRARSFLVDTVGAPATGALREAAASHADRDVRARAAAALATMGATNGG
jgi:serine/threonine-protein kinase